LHLFGREPRVVGNDGKGIPGIGAIGEDVGLDKAHFLHGGYDITDGT
jgi:hypothetical protein